MIRTPTPVFYFHGSHGARWCTIACSSYLRFRTRAASLPRLFRQQAILVRDSCDAAAAVSYTNPSPKHQTWPWAQFVYEVRFAPVCTANDSGDCFVHQMASPA